MVGRWLDREVLCMTPKSNEAEESNGVDLAEVTRSEF